MTEVACITSLVAQFDELLGSREALGTDAEHGHFSDKLIHIYQAAESILARNEARLALWNTTMCEIQASSWSSLHHVNDAASRHFWACISNVFDTVLTFRTLLDYHSVTLFWTIIMWLRLVLADLLTSIANQGATGVPACLQHKAEDHRIQLMKYAQKVVQSLCYAAQTESREVGPFVFVTAFQLAVVVLKRERKLLQAADDCDEAKLRRCDDLEGLVVHYLNWITEEKIPVKIDLRTLTKWGQEHIAYS